MLPNISYHSSGEVTDTTVAEFTSITGGTSVRNKRKQLLKQASRTKNLVRRETVGSLDDSLHDLSNHSLSLISVNSCYSLGVSTLGNSSVGGSVSNTVKGSTKWRQILPKRVVVDEDDNASISSKGSMRSQRSLVRRQTLGLGLDNLLLEDDSDCHEPIVIRKKHQQQNLTRVSNNHRQIYPGEKLNLKSKRKKKLPIKKTKILFGKVDVREYDTIVGDNPSCSGGPPVSIGWKYRHIVSLPVDEFESFRKGERAARASNLILSRHERVDHLLSCGFSQAEVVDSIRKLNKSKSQRRQTINNLSAARLEEAFEAARGKVKSFLRPHTAKREKDLLKASSIQDFKIDHNNFEKSILKNMGNQGSSRNQGNSSKDAEQLDTVLKRNEKRSFFTIVAKEPDSDVFV